MKKILLLTTKYPEQAEHSWLTNELAECFASRGFEIQVIVLSWEYNDGGSKSSILNGVNIHRLRLPKLIYKKIFIFSMIKIILFSLMARLRFRTIVSGANLTVVTTPCISVWALIRKNKNSRSHLILWDFFPYYMKDIWSGVKQLLFHPFLVWENSLFNKFNTISCMTSESVDFLKSRYGLNNDISIDIIPLWTKQKHLVFYSPSERREIRKKFNISADAFVVAYGGAITEIQNLSSLLNVARSLLGDNSFQFVIIGSGPDLENLKSKVAKELISNVVFIDRVNRDVYSQLISSCDVGIVSLSALHAVPSFPSKSIDYLKVGLPIIAYIDGTSEFGNVLEEQMRAGFAVMHGNINEFIEKLTLIKSNKNLREELSLNGRRYYEKNFSVDVAVDQILKGLN